MGILAHVDSGKTTLSEALLYQSGAIKKLGRVDHKNSFLDTFNLERDRGITIFSKQAEFETKNTRFTLLDTPGHIDFSAETERTLQVLDYAILVVSAASGIQSHTHTLWNLLSKYNVPVFIFVNKTDLDGADKSRVLEELKTKFSSGCVDFGEENKEEFYENLALCHEKLLNEYYEKDCIDHNLITEYISRRKIFPCYFGSALKLDGTAEFLQGLDSYTKMPLYGDEFGAKVYKISEDKGQRLTHLKVTGGTLNVRDTVISPKNKEGEKINQIRIYNGDKFTVTDKAESGTVCAVTGITFAQSGDGLGCEKNSSMPILQPVLNYRLELPEGADPHKAFNNMKILEREDPQLKVVWNQRLSEIHIQLMGDIQLEVLQELIKERFDMSVAFSKGSIIYKETISDTVEGVGHFEPLRHYAEVHLILKPGKRNSGIVIKNECKEDVLDKNWQRLIITHLYEKTHLGVLTGSPITDIEIILASGKAHPKHTEGGDFRQATYRAVRHGLRQAKSVLLEPVYEFTLEIPTENTGRAITDIQRMSGTFDTPENTGEFTVIKGTAPVSEMGDYAREVVQYTHGKGKLACALKGYEPCHNSDEVIETLGYDCDGDTDNPCDSVFCSHGSGYNVKWNQVKSHMHLPSALSKPKTAGESVTVNKDFSTAKYKGAKDLFALDKELMAIFEKTYGPVKNRNGRENQNHFTFTESAEKKEYKKQSKGNYDGVEYLLVDGYNVIHSWDRLKKLAEDNLETARNVLVNILCNYQGYRKCNLIVVFDAYKVKGNVGEVEKQGNITIVYTKEAETADMYIEKASYKLAKTNKVRVVTSDALEQLIILEGGALRVSSAEFQYEVEQAENNIREIISKTY